MKSHGKGKNGTKKYGRNEIKCARYLRENRRKKNKLRSIAKHLKRHIHDLVALKNIEKFRV